MRGPWSALLALSILLVAACTRHPVARPGPVLPRVPCQGYVDRLPEIVQGGSIDEVVSGESSKPIVQIEVKGTRSIPLSLVRAVLSSKAGLPLDTAAVQQVLVECGPSFVIEQVVLEGNQRLAHQILMAALRGDDGKENGAGDVYWPEGVQAGLKRIEFVYLDEATWGWWQTR